ncbi:RNA-binding protein [Caminicella sporogenes]|uniref:YlmH family RNA-binding protein n=1 Tax=Caminicella sporogenes TaxID=166485 RepID=UPI002540FFDF|nr:YlmH/Sll1252 family protein [Caminicella sporogenes]WIF94567.1 YlmH/Sll1252 family protein [Caminicella sporogenes]
MNKKDILSKYLLNNEQKMQVLKILDKAALAEKKQIIRYSDFIDPYLYIILKDILTNLYNISFKGFGGYEKAERKIFIFYPNYLCGDYIDFPIKLINLQNLPKNKVFTHREVLGAILSLGLKRDKIGDIIISKDIIQILVLEEVADFIELYFKKIGRFSINVSIGNIDSIVPKIEEFKEISANVKSLRLDSVCSASFFESRNKVAEDIKKGKIKVNYRPINMPSYILEEGDMVSYRGKGRIIFEKIQGKTKKDRYKINIKKFV